MRNVHKTDAKVINLPTDQLKEDRGYKFCGKPYLTFANPEDGSVSWQNDLFSVAFIADSVEVVLEKDGTELTAFGVTLDFPNQPDAVGFMVIWREVLLNHGAGCYKVKANYMLQGFEFTLHYGSFDLMPYSVAASESTIRVLGQYNDEVKMYGINFAGSSFARTFRVKGNLHNEQPNTEHGNILKGDDKFAKYRNHGQISYDLETAPLVACELDPLFELLISSNKIYVSDFNSANFRQYRDVEVILRGDEEISYGEQFGHERQLFAPFKQKNWLVESKYSEGAGDGQIFTSGLDFDNLVCPTFVCADATFTISDSQGNLIDSGSIPSGGNEDVTLPEIWWERPEGWLPMPTITAADNKFAGLYAVWEEDVDNNTITINVGAGQTIDYGDGTVITSIAGTNTHNYDYATISSAVLISSDGRNYKMVIVEVDITGVITMLLNQGITGRPNRPTGWLDILASGGSLTEIRISGNPASLLGFAKYLERLRVLNMSATGVLVNNAFQNLSSIRVVDYPLLTNGTGFNAAFNGSSDIRDSSGNPLNITGVSGTDFRQFTVNSGLTKIGNIDYPTGTLSSSAFQTSRIQEIGNINFPSITEMSNFLQISTIKTIGTVTVTTALTNISRFSRNSRNIREIVFAGDMSGVNSTLFSFENANSLTRLILPNITIGFNIKDSRVSGTNLQDLFTSLGTANGAQTITLPSFTSGESTIIATGKGYTIAYA